MNRLPSRCWLLLALAVAAGCSGTAARGLLPQPQAAAPSVRSRLGSSVTFTVRLPISSAPKSIVVTAYDGSHVHQLGQSTMAIAPGAGGCSAAASGWFSCQASIGVPLGFSTYDAAAYAGAGATGPKTPLLGNFGFTASEGGANAVALAYAATATSLALTIPGGYFFATGTQAAGFQFAGIGRRAAARLQLTALDAAGDVVVGPLAPRLALASSNAGALEVTAVAKTLGRLYTVTPLQQNAGLTLAASGTLGGKTVLHASAAAKLQPVLAVIDCWNTTVTEYAPWSETPIATITGSSGIAANSAMAVDAQGNLYLANHVGASKYAAGISVFPMGKTAASRSIANVNEPQFVAVDAAGDIFVDEANADVEEFTPGGGAVPSRVLSASTSPAGIDQPYGLAVDAKGNLYVANAGSIGVSVYAPGTSTTPVAVISNGTNGAQWLAFDAAGNLYVANDGASNVAKYAPPFTNASVPARTFGSGATISGPQAMALDAKGNVYVVNGTLQNVVEFSPGGPVVRTIAGLSLYGTNLVATDQLNNAYVPDENGYGAVHVYAPGTSTTPAFSYTKGFSGPMDVAVWP